MILSFNARLTIAFLTGLVGLIWQGVVVSTGGEASEALITASSTLILATLGIGIKVDSDNSKN